MAIRPSSQVRPSLLKALFAQESGLGAGFTEEEANARVSEVGAEGIGQIMPKTFRGLVKNYGEAFQEDFPGETPSVKNPAHNKYFAELALAENLDYYNGNEALALAAYNTGHENVEKALSKIGKSKDNASFEDIKDLLPTETQNYVPEIYARESKKTLNADEQLLARDKKKDSKPVGLEEVDITNLYKTPEVVSDDPFEAAAQRSKKLAGTLEDFKTALAPTLLSDDAHKKTANELLKAYSDAYNSKSSWDTETENKFKDSVASLLQGTKGIDYSQVFGPFEFTQDAPITDQLDAWKAKGFSNLEAQGVAAKLLEKDAEGYLNDVYDMETQAYHARTDSSVAKGGKVLRDYAREGLKGVATLATDVIAGGLSAVAPVVGSQGLDNSISFINEIPSKILGESDFNYRYYTDAKGYVSYDADGNPEVNPGSFIASAGTEAFKLGTLGAGASALKVSVGASLGTSYVAGGLNDAYMKSKQVGAGTKDTYLNMIGSVPINLMDSIIDSSILGGATPALKTLSPLNKRKLISNTLRALEAGKTASKSLVGSPLIEGGQEVVQDYATQKLDEATFGTQTDPSKLVESGVVGTLTGGILGGANSLSNLRQRTPSQKSEASVESLPTVTEQSTLISQLEGFQKSSKLTDTLSTPIEKLDPAILDTMKIKAVANPDGTTSLEKETTYKKPVVATAVQKIDEQIDSVIGDLKTSVSEETLTALSDRQVQLQEKLKEFEGKDSESSVNLAELKSKRASLESEKSLLEKRTKRYTDPKQAAVYNKKLEKVNKELSTVNKALEPYVGSTLDQLTDYQADLKATHASIANMMDPYYANNISAKEEHLRELVQARDAIREEKHNEEVKAYEDYKKAAEANKSAEKPKKLKEVKEPAPLERGLKVTDKRVEVSDLGWAVVDSKQEVVDVATTFAEAYDLATAESPDNVLFSATGTDYQVSKNDNTPLFERPYSDSYNKKITTSPTEKKLRPDVTPNKKTISKAFSSGITFNRDGAKPLQVSKILNTLNKKLKDLNTGKTPLFSLRVSKTKTKNVKDSSKVLGYVVRDSGLGIVKDNKILTMLHEFAHSLDFSKNVDWKAQKLSTINGLVETAATFYPGYQPVKMSLDTKLKEGWAMFVEMYLAGHPVHSDVLSFYNNEFKTDFPDAHKAIEDVKKDTFEYFNQSPATELTAKRKAENPGWITRLNKYIKENFTKANFLDDYAPFKEISDQVYNTALATRGSIQAVANNALLNYLPKNHYTPQVQGESFQQIIKPIKDVSAFNDYMAIMHETNNIWARKIDTGVSVETLNKRLEELKVHPEFDKIQQTAQKAWDWWAKYLDILAGTSKEFGVFRDATVKKNLELTETSHGYYYPRIVVQDKNSNDSAEKNRVSSFLGLKGSDKAIKGYVEATQENARILAAKAERLVVKEQVLSAFNRGNVGAYYIRQVEKDKGVTYRIPVQKLIDQLQSDKRTKAYIDVNGVVSNADEIIEFYGDKLDLPKASEGYKIITDSVYDPSAKTINLNIYEVRKELADALLATPAKEVISNDTALGRVLNSAAGGLTELIKLTAVSYNPKVQLMLHATDILSALERFKDTKDLPKFFVNYAVSFADGLNNLAYELGGKKIGIKRSGWSELLELTGATAGNGNVAVNDNLKNNYSIIGKTAHNILYKARSLTRVVANTLESVPRAAAVRTMFPDVDPTNLTPTQAIEIINAFRFSTNDFSRKGRVVRNLDKVQPFIGAGLSVMTQSFQVLGDKRNRLKMAVIASSALGVGIAKALQHRDDDWWKNLDTKQKYLNFYDTMLDENGVEKIVRVRMPSISGIFYGAGIAIYDALDNAIGDKDLRDGTALDLVASLIGANIPVPGLDKALAGKFGEAVTSALPTGAKEGLELALGINTFTNQPIVPSSVKSLPAQEQYVSSTTETAKKLGEITNIAPVKLDFIINKLGLISQINKAIDNGLHPEKGNTDPMTPFIGARTGTAVSKSINLLYEQANKAAKMEPVENRKSGQAEYRRQLEKTIESLKLVRYGLQTAETKEQYNYYADLQEEIASKGMRLINKKDANISLPYVDRAGKMANKQVKKERDIRIAERLLAEEN